jgi:hypothetical protein
MTYQPDQPPHPYFTPARGTPTTRTYPPFPTARAARCLLDPWTAVPMVKRAEIGDAYLGAPAIRCEIGYCRAFFADPGALSTHGVWRAAHTAGWQRDWIGRYACPPCVQGNRSYRPDPSALPVPYDAGAAMASMAAATRKGAAA